MNMRSCRLKKIGEKCINLYWRCIGFLVLGFYRKRKRDKDDIIYIKRLG